MKHGHCLDKFDDIYLAEAYAKYCGGKVYTSYNKTDSSKYTNISMFTEAMQKQLRLVPYKTVSSKQMMLVFPCTIRLEGQEVLHHYVALTKQTSLFPGQCSMLLHVSMLDYS